jgi:hypothetical protein
VFLSRRGERHRRSNFSCRVLRPAADGITHLRRPTVALSPAKSGLAFHGLRHGHKSWMIADQIPEVAQSRRLGHLLEDKIQETYSHVAAEVETRLLQAVEDRWNKAVVNSPDNPRWRACAQPPRAGTGARDETAWGTRSLLRRWPRQGRDESMAALVRGRPRQSFVLRHVRLGGRRCSPVCSAARPAQCPITVACR